MNNQEETIVSAALERLHEKLDFNGKYFPANGRKAMSDGTLSFKRKTTQLKFIVECKKEVRRLHINQLVAHRATLHEQPFLLIAGRIMPDARKDLKAAGINYIEANGNTFMDVDGQYILIDGAPPAKWGTDKTNRAFTKTGLKVVFLLLTHPQYVKSTYRDIATKAETSLGNVTNVMNGLKESGHVLAINHQEWQLVNKKELLQKWMDAYEHRLKPTLEMGSFRFLKSEDFLQWKSLPLNIEKTVWGGEAAGDLLTNYLRPAILTLYTDETRNELVRHYRIVPDEQGNIKAYKKFWQQEEYARNVVPPLLAYADLISTGDRRCLETAEKIYNEFLQDKL